MSLGSKFALFY